jgi:hypothetical protein
MQEMTTVHSAYTKKKKKNPINNSQLLINKYYFKTFSRLLFQLDQKKISLWPKNYQFGLEKLRTLKT